MRSFSATEKMPVLVSLCFFLCGKSVLVAFLQRLIAGGRALLHLWLQQQVTTGPKCHNLVLGFLERSNSWTLWPYNTCGHHGEHECPSVPWFTKCQTETIIDQNISRHTSCLVLTSSFTFDYILQLGICVHSSARVQSGKT